MKNIRLAPHHAPFASRHQTTPDPFEHVSYTKTDVQATWRRHGWAPPDRHQQAATKARLNKHDDPVTS